MVLFTILRLNASKRAAPFAGESLELFVGVLAFVLPPMCIGIAILRYRLWDIDLIIHRTLVYSILTLSVIGLYVLVVVGLGTLFQVQGNLAAPHLVILPQLLKSWVPQSQAPI